MTSKRGAKSMDAPALSRMPSRIGGASIVSRFTMAEKPKTPRMQRFARFSRHAPRLLKPQHTDFKIRTSVAELVMKELDSYDRCIFFQRVYILTKNIVLSIEADSSMDSILSRYMQSKTSVASAEVPVEAEVEVFVESEMEETSHQLLDAEANLIEAKSSKEHFRDSLLKITRADLEAPPTKEKHLQELNFFDQFKTRLEDIIKQVETDQLSEDKFSGLLLCMGNSHSLIVLEGTEDTIANFCQELMNISNEYFEALRVFMVEDRIEETYFDGFIYRRSVAMNTTEKFPPPTANDPFLMGPQHWLIKEKLHTICRTLSYELRPVLSEIVDIAPQPTIVIVEEEKKEPKKKHIIKRKKSPKPSKAKPIAAPPVKQPTSEPTARSAQDGSGDATSAHSAARASIGSATSMVRGSKTELETTEVATELPEELPEAVSLTAVGDAPAPPGTAADEEATIGKETLNTFASFMGEKEAEIALQEEEDNIEPREILSEFAMSPAIYNRLLPEVQRIDLVLTSKRFYLDVAEFLRFSQQIPMQADEDASMWPTAFNYMPVNIFQRLPFDVNLTFGSYDIKEEEDESSSEGEEKEGDEEEGEKKQEEAG